MKTKLTILVLLTLMVITGCTVTSTFKDKEMLQKQYKTVYSIDQARYVTIDSVGNVFDVRVSADGKILSTIEIR